MRTSPAVRRFTAREVCLSLIRDASYRDDAVALCRFVQDYHPGFGYMTALVRDAALAGLMDEGLIERGACTPPFPRLGLDPRDRHFPVRVPIGYRLRKQGGPP
jgi:hypothetical protein